MTDSSTQPEAAAKLEHLEWIARLYSYEEIAISDEVANTHLFDRLNDFGMRHFLETYRPLNKLREQRGPLVFRIGAVTHPEPDVTFAELIVDDEVQFVQRVRFEKELPCRIRYWSSYPPLPMNINLRPYTPADAAGCVALERLCPMESADGTRWTLDRGEAFDDYLQLMAPIDAWVAEYEGEIVGFFSCALRPIRFNGESCYSVYQHHYRIHPDHRRGSISVALASHVDPRRTFDGLPVVFPYSMVDPNNVHMQHVGFPAVEEVRISRISLSLEKLRTQSLPIVRLETPSQERVVELMTETHGDRVLFPALTGEFLQDRWSRIAQFDINNYHSTNDALLGLWLPQELNLIERDGQREERRLGFVLDYGSRSVRALLAVLQQVSKELVDGSATTHLSVLCDTRAPEYEALLSLADDEARLAVHTLPWITEPLREGVLYCDGLYC